MIEKNIKRLGFLGLMLAILASCTSGDLGIALDLNPNGQVGVTKIDTLTIETSTIRLDSISTSGNGTMMVGKTNQQNFGKISSSAYFQIGLPASTLNGIEGTEKLTYDSLVLVLRYAGTIGDTTLSQTIAINPLAELPSETRYHYNTSSVPSQSAIIGSKTLKPRPKSDSAVNITLSNTLGNQLFEYLKANSSAEQFQLLKINKGMVLKSISNIDASLLRFAVGTSYIRLYTHTDVTKTEYNVTFPIRAGVTQFNSISYDSKFPSINSLVKPLSEVNSKSTDNQSFVYSGIPLGTKISIPYIEQLKFINNFYLVNKVELEISAVRKSLNDFQTAPSTLSVFTLNRSNQITGNLLGYTGAAVTGAYTLSTEDPLVFKSLYSFDITNYFQQVLSGQILNKGLLLNVMSGTDSGSTITGVTLGNSIKSNYRIKLHVYYTQGG